MPTVDPKLGTTINALRSCQLFGGLPAPDLALVAALAAPRILKKGDYLFHEWDAPRGLFVVQTGAISVHRTSPFGKQQVILVARGGESLGEGTLASETGYPADAHAVEPSLVWFIRKADLLALMRSQPQMALRMLAAMALHLRVLVDQIEDLMLKDVDTRLANWLIKHCPDPHSRQPVVIHLNQTKRSLAAELSTVGETISRTFAKFRSQQLVAVRGRSVTVLCPKQLNQLLDRNLAGNRPTN